MDKKGLNEDFAKFFENPDRTSFRELLKQNKGEFDHIDFKKIWKNDPEIAKQILGFANSGGGVLVIGVEEKPDGTMDPVGITKFEDKTVLKSKLEKYLPNSLQFDIYNFDYDNSPEWGSIKNKKYQVLIVEDTPQNLPFLSLKAYDPILQKNRVYYRSKSNTEEARHDELQKIINRRIDTNVSTTKSDEFKEHLNQLKLLFQFLDEYERTQYMYPLFTTHSIMRGSGYPNEDYRTFLIRMIKNKTEIIEKITKS